MLYNMCRDEFSVQDSRNREMARDVRWWRRGCLVVTPKI